MWTRIAAVTLMTKIGNWESFDAKEIADTVNLLTSKALGLVS